MTYEEEKKIIDAAIVLMEYCKKSCCNSDNANCLFEKNKGVCSIRKDYPTAWEIPKLTRWTPEDVALAKALKAIGVYSIYRDEAGLRWNKIKPHSFGSLPIDSFKSLDLYKNICLDTIIKESEE
jgi:hypothetical protein